jgi:type II secretory pathway component PulF
VKLQQLDRAWARLTLTANVRLRVYRKIATMLANGLPLLRILDDLYLRASLQGQKPSQPLAIALSEWKRSVQNGRTLAEGMRDWVPRAEQLVILAAEQSGRLESGLGAVVDVVQAARRIRASIAGGAAYPVLLLAIVLTYVYLFGTVVVPEFARVSDPARWRGAGHALHLMSTWVRDWMPYLVLLLTAVAIAFFLSLPRWRGNTRLLADRLPPYSLYRMVQGSGFLFAFSALLSAGITVEKSLLRLCECADPWLRERLEGTLLGVKSGLNCGEALKNAGYGFPSREIVDDLCIHAEYRGFPEVLRMVADEWLEEGVAHVSRQMKVLNGFAIGLLALAIAFLVSGMFSIQQHVGSAARLLQ